MNKYIYNINRNKRSKTRDALAKFKNLPYIFHFAGRHEARYKESKKYLDLLRELGHNP